MTRIQKHRLKVSLSCIVPLAFFMLLDLYLLQSPMQHSAKMLILASVCVLLIMVPLLLNLRKQKIVLTVEDRQRPLPETADFSNRIEWRIFWVIIGLIAYALVLLQLPMLSHLHETMSWSKAFECWLTAWQDISRWPWLLIATGVVVATISVFLYGRNQYIIDANTLIVREYSFFRPESELRIPLDTISEVYIKNSYTIIPALYLNINGIHRRLYTTTHTFDLAVALHSRL